MSLTWADRVGCWTYVDGAAGVDAEPVGGLLGGLDPHVGAVDEQLDTRFEAEADHSNDGGVC